MLNTFFEYNRKDNGVILKTLPLKIQNTSFERHFFQFVIRKNNILQRWVTAADIQLDVGLTIKAATTTTATATTATTATTTMPENLRPWKIRLQSKTFASAIGFSIH